MSSYAPNELAAPLITVVPEDAPIRAGASLDAGPAPGAGKDRRYLLLPVILSATFMQLIDVSIVNVAIPSIQANLHASFVAVELMVSVYLLAFAVTLITGGRLGDIFGRRRLLLIGMAGFTLASAVCGAAPTAAVLVVARIFQPAPQAAATALAQKAVRARRRYSVGDMSQRLWKHRLA